MHTRVTDQVGMSNCDGNGFLRQLRTIPTYRDCFGREAVLQDVIALIEMYPLSEWLSFLSRIQSILASYKMDEVEKTHRLISGTVGPTVLQRLQSAGFLRHKGMLTEQAIYYEWQVSTLQQLAIRHAPETGTAKLETDDGRDALSMALLMTMDLMVADRSTSGATEPFIHDQIRTRMAPWWMYAARAFYFYELDRRERSDPLSTYLGLFEKANVDARVSAADCIWGGLAILLHEDGRSPDEIADAWCPLVHLDERETPEEAGVLAAYKTVRMGSLAQLRALISEREWDKEQGGMRPIRDWNLIALSQSPICDLGQMGAFVLNHTAVGRSLFDSVRHTILTAALERRLPAPYADREAIGELYGKVFESYVFSVFEQAFRSTGPERVWRIPKNEREKRADLLIWFPDKVVVIEVKGVHFVGRDHASFMSLQGRQEELQKIKVAIDQLEQTARSLRAGELRAPSMPAYDWTITPIIPVIVTEEQTPQVPGCWNVLYVPLCQRLDDLAPAGPIGKLRILTIRDVEGLPDLQIPHDLGTMLYRWGADTNQMEWPWGCFLEAQGIKIPYGFLLERFHEAMKSLAGRLGLGRGAGG
jgi:hypothetical protein